jgi:hypothetical protein
VQHYLPDMWHHLWLLLLIWALVYNYQQPCGKFPKDLVLFFPVPLVMTCGIFLSESV